MAYCWSSVPAGTQRCTMNMGNFPSLCFKRKFRWFFYLDGVADDGTEALVAIKGSRPALTFKEAEIQHLSEVIYTPIKAEWKPLPLTLLDVHRKKHPIMAWIRKIYNISTHPTTGSINQISFRPRHEPCVTVSENWTETLNDLECFKRIDANLLLLDGCGYTLEEWRFENIWPQEIDFGDLDMSSSDVVTVSLTLRYDRAYLVEGY